MSAHATRPLPIIVRMLALTLAAGTLACVSRASGPARSVVTAIERELTGSAPEVARYRDVAMSVLADYGRERRPLDVPAVHASAVHAARVYRSPDAIREELGPGVHALPLLTDITGLQYYAIEEGDRLVVAIRGTEPADLRNWVASAVVLGARDEVLGLDVHRGVLLAARVLQASLVARLDQSRPVHLTGHSLGGALATLLALRLDRLGYAVTITTFGAPKITTFAAFANEPRIHRLDLTRIVNAGDVVHHFPPTMDTSGRRVYTQFGDEWTLTVAGRCAPTDLRESLSKSAALVLDRNLPEWSLHEHAMETYLARLAQLAGRGPDACEATPDGSGASPRSSPAPAAAPA